MNENLISLPVPDLSATVAQYLEALQMIVDTASFAKSQKMAYDFVNGEGRLLQERLVSYAQMLNGESWLKEYSKERFLSLRAPLSLTGNFTIEFKKETAKNIDQIDTGAKLAHSIGRLYQDIANGRLAPPKEAASSICKEQFAQVLGAARHPHEKKDTYTVYAPFKQANCFGLFYKNRYFLIRIFDNDGNLINCQAIRQAITRVVQDGYAPLEVNFHTAGFAGSDKCAKFIESICGDSKNLKNYDKVCKSIFHLALDENPKSIYSTNYFLYSNTENLWLYKPWSFTVFQDGAVTVNNEHTAIDGLANLYLYKQVFQYIIQYQPSENMKVRVADTEEIDFNFNKSQLNELKWSRAKYLRQIESFCCTHFRREGIDWGQFKNRGIGKDALIQCAFTYAQYRMYGSYKSTHESVSMAQYHQGRTSCIRSVTKESAALAEFIANSGEANETFFELLKTASAKHSDNIRRAKQNICFIRHSAGLLLVYNLYGKELGITYTPSIFTDDNYKRYCEQYFSTSTLGDWQMTNSFAYAPTVAGGLGLGYITGGIKFTSVSHME